MKNIEMGKKYRCRDGVPATVLAVGLNSSCPVAAVRHTKLGDEVIQLNVYGRWSIIYDDSCDLIEIGPYDDFKIDDKVMVSDRGRQWVKLHFAGVDAEGRPLSFPCGQTQWTHGLDSPLTPWNLCRRPTPEELMK